MIFDFSEPITAYEFWAIVLSVIALLIPAFKWVHNRYIKKIKIDFLPSGKITLFFNKSGTYVSLGGVYDISNKSATIKDISVNIIRKSDNATLPLTWSTFPSPVFRQIAGNYETSFETAHAIKAEGDALTPVFVEFASSSENMNQKFDSMLEPLFRASYMIPESVSKSPYEFDHNLQELEEYHQAELDLNDSFFWKKGEYILELTTSYNDSSFVKKYRFKISEDETKLLRENIKTILLSPVIQKYNLRISMNTVCKSFTEDN